MLAEERLDLTVEATRLGPGESVIVVTKMGREIGRGVVQEIDPVGPVHIKVKDPDGRSGVKEDRLYDPLFYSFIPLNDDGQPRESNVEPEVDPGLDVDDDPPEQSLDDRVEAKMRRLGVSLEANGPANSNDNAGANGGGNNNQGGNGNDEPPPKDDVRGDTREPESKVDIEGLPEPIKQKIIGVKGLDEAQKNRVLSEIGDAALRSLRSAGVKDTEIYSTVDRIQKAVLPVLEKKK